ncbi:MAG TPA: septum formation initiator family protein [Ignavibacteriales bacterium]|nr:septum formation initiator family protein [Ignavibacteriales bacterium]
MLIKGKSFSGKTLVVIGLLTAGVLFLTLNKFSVVKYLSMKSELNSLRQEEVKAKDDNKALRERIDSLKTNDAMIEKIAREKYNMVKKGEKIIKVEEK